MTIYLTVTLPSGGLALGLAAAVAAWCVLAGVDWWTGRRA